MWRHCNVYIIGTLSTWFAAQKPPHSVSWMWNFVFIMYHGWGWNYIPQMVATYKHVVGSFKITNTRDIWIIASDKSLAPNRQQAVVLTNDDPVQWHMYVISSLSELIHWDLNKWLIFSWAHFQMHFVQQNVAILFVISLKLAPKDIVDKKSALVWIMAQCQTEE